MTNTYKEFYQKYNISKLKIFENKNWIVSLRPEQKTPFSLLLTIKSDKNKLCSLNKFEMNDLIKSYDFIETLSYDKLGAIKVNYICLMMVDSIIHYHVFPRFKSDINLFGFIMKDIYYPRPVDILDSFSSDIDVVLNILSKLK